MLDDTDDIHPLFHGAPKGLEFRKLRKRLVQQVREAIDTYGMAKPGDRWLVCLSGGKDSYTLLAILHELKWRGLLPVDLLACNLDQGQPNFPATVLPAFLTRMGVPHRIEYQDTYSVVIDKIKPGGTMCSLCSRLRRGNLYRIAREEGCSTVVLGHHRDDILETFFMNLFHGGRRSLRGPPPGLRVRRRLRQVRRCNGLSDHPLRPLRQPGGVAAGPGEEASRRMGGADTGAATSDVPVADERPVLASCRPDAVRFRWPCRHRERSRGGRSGQFYATFG